MLERIHILISIISAVVVTIISIVDGSDLSVMVVRLITIIVSCYVIGLIVRSYLTRKVFFETEEAKLRKVLLGEPELIEDGSGEDVLQEDVDGRDDEDTDDDMEGFDFNEKKSF